jgi:hypothetical protein
MRLWDSSEMSGVMQSLNQTHRGAEYSGLWTPGHYHFRHKSLPPPIAPALPAPADGPKIKPVQYGVWNGQRFVPTRPFDVSIHTKEERIRFLNEFHPIGDDVRYFVNDTEVSETDLRPGQPYSVYPRKIERPNDSTANTKDKHNPVRTEGPMVHIQWWLLSEKGESVMLTTPATVPEEISLAQLWHRHIANRYKKSVDTIRWGKHFRDRKEIESGQVSELCENDGVEIIIGSEKKTNGQVEVIYTLGDETQVFRFNVKESATVEDAKKRISQTHKGKPIQSLVLEGAEMSDEDSFKE